MSKPICGIYKITNIVNGKVYIGQSIDVYDRWYQHKYEAHRDRYNTLLYKAMRKYGIEKFEFEVIEECFPDKLSDLEQYYINYYHAYIGFENSNGYNMTIGGEGISGYTQTDEHIEKRVKQIRGKSSWNKGKHYHTGVHNYGEDNPFYGCHHTEKTKQNLSKQHLGKVTASLCKQVICDNVVYQSISECARYYNVSISTMNDWLRGNRGMPQEFYDLGLNTIPQNNNIYIAHKASGAGNGSARKVVCITTNKVFDTIKEASDFYNANINSIIRVCQHKSNSAGQLSDGTKLQWAYYEDYLKGGGN